RFDQGLVPVVAERAHQGRRPLPFGGRPRALAVAPGAPADPGGQDVVAVPEDVGTDADGAADDGLGRIAARRRGADAPDDDPIGVDGAIGHVVLVYHSSNEANRGVSRTPALWIASYVREGTEELHRPGPAP